MNNNEPDVFQHYRVLRRPADGKLWELGRGAMGVTYKAVDTRLHVNVALKIIHERFLLEEQARERFLREARAAASLRHRNVASVFHLGEYSNNYFYVMEFVEGETLEALVERSGPLSVIDALSIVLQVSRALIAGHSKKLVHRDIKPSNVMLTDEVDEAAVVKLIDFGLAKPVVEAGGASLSDANTSGFLGTPRYASPEQCDERPLDIRSDIYSLGTTLWYLLAGHPPFNGSIGQVFAQHLSKEPPFEQLPAHIPANVVALLARMLEKDPAERQATPSVLRREIEECSRAAPAAGLVVPLTTLEIHRSTGDTESKPAARADQAGSADEADLSLTTFPPKPPAAPLAEVLAGAAGTVKGHPQVSEASGDSSVLSGSADATVVPRFRRAAAVETLAGTPPPAHRTVAPVAKTDQVHAPLSDLDEVEVPALIDAPEISAFVPALMGQVEEAPVCAEELLFSRSAPAMERSRRFPLVPIAIGAVVLVAAIGGIMHLRRDRTPPVAASSQAVSTPPAAVLPIEGARRMDPPTKPAVVTSAPSPELAIQTPTPQPAVLEAVATPPPDMTPAPMVEPAPPPVEPTQPPQIATSSPTSRPLRDTASRDSTPKPARQVQQEVAHTRIEMGTSTQRQKGSESAYSASKKTAPASSSISTSTPKSSGSQTRNVDVFKGGAPGG